MVAEKLMTQLTPELWQGVHELLEPRPARYLNWLAKLNAGDSGGLGLQLKDYYRNYQQSVHSHRPQSMAKLGPIQESRWRFLANTNFNFSPFNAIAERLNWPLVNGENSQTAIQYYNEAGRQKVLFQQLYDSYSAIEDLIPEFVAALIPANTEDSAAQVDLFLVAGSSGPERMLFTSKLLRDFKPMAMCLAMGDRAAYMGDKQFAFTEAEAAVLTALNEDLQDGHRYGQSSELDANRFLLDCRSRITNDHPRESVAFIRAVSTILGRAIHVGAVTSQFHCARFSYLLQRHFHGLGLFGEDSKSAQGQVIAKLTAYAIPIPIHRDSPRLPHVLNEYLKLLYELCVLD